MTQSEINPMHYELEVKGHKFEVADLMEARFSQDAHLAQALKYLMRAGRKASTSYVKDVAKCLWWCAKAILYRGGTFELPEGSPFTPKVQRKVRRAPVNLRGRNRA